MNTIPKVAIAPEKGGWSARCLGCGWEMYHVGRPVLDKAAGGHRDKCKRGAR